MEIRKATHPLFLFQLQEVIKTIKEFAAEADPKNTEVVTLQDFLNFFRYQEQWALSIANVQYPFIKMLLTSFSIEPPKP